MSLTVGDKVKFDRESYTASEFDSPELLEIVAQGIVGTVEGTRERSNLEGYPYRIIFPTPSPFRNVHTPIMAVNAYEHELTLVGSYDSDAIETLLEPLVKAYGL